MQQWRTERPDLDPSPQGVIGRLHRIGARLTERLVEVYAEHGLDEGEFDILATLRRGGAPYALTPSELAATRAGPVPGEVQAGFGPGPSAGRTAAPEGVLRADRDVALQVYYWFQKIPVK